MQGKSELLHVYMNSHKLFEIPAYQRNYDWKEENCKQLFDDLVRLKRSGRKSHFFGCIVSVHDSFSPDGGFLIIDGQQRLTTVSLLFLAVCNLIDAGELISKDENLSQMIREEYLINKWKSKETRIRLKPIKKDRKALENLFEDPSKHIADSNLTKNYQYFCKRLRSCELSADEIYDALKKLCIINIHLNPEDDPQLIFESLNSTGLDLSEGDKIRNFVLMGQDVSTQERFYEEYWNPIEECTNYDVSAFVRDFLSVKQGVTPVISRTYFAFKEYVQGREAYLAMEDLLRELLTYARYYAKLLYGDTGHRGLDACIFRLNWLETTVCRPFLLEVLHQYYTEKVLSLDEVAGIFQVVESFVFRRAVCDVPTNALNKIFVSLHKDVVRLAKDGASYIDRLKYSLSIRRESGRFPDDAEFGEAFVTRPVYKMKSKNKTYLLERLENYGTAEVKDVWNLLREGVYSIEHIMPQTLSKRWKEHLGPDFASIHEVWCHRIANLTLTAYNSDYSNRSFEEKCNHPKGFKQSGIRMNQLIKDAPCWRLEQLEERSAQLRERALEIWPSPTTAFRPTEKLLESCSLDEDYDLLGRLIVRFQWKGTDYPVKSWADMYQQVVKLLHEENSSVLAKLMSGTEESFWSNQFATYRPDKRIWWEIAPQIWLLAHIDNQQKVLRLRRFFELYGEDPADLVFYLRSSDGRNGEFKDEPARYEIRRRYWNFALEHIHAVHADGGTFQNVNGSSSNWINGAIGYGGIVLCCVANQDGSRMELYLGTVDKSLNKKVFDALYLRRSAIESALEQTLQWERKEEGKASKIFLELNEVDIYDETHWPRMAEFHATWSRKFYDVFKPRLDEIMSTL